MNRTTDCWKCGEALNLADVFCRWCGVRCRDDDHVHVDGLDEDDEREVETHLVHTAHHLDRARDDVASEDDGQLLRAAKANLDIVLSHVQDREARRGR